MITHLSRVETHTTLPRAGFEYHNSVATSWTPLYLNERVDSRHTNRGKAWQSLRREHIHHQEAEVLWDEGWAHEDEPPPAPGPSFGLLR